jgi:hypothetical protein
MIRVSGHIFITGMDALPRDESIQPEFSYKKAEDY